MYRPMEIIMNIYAIIAGYIVGSVVGLTARWYFLVNQDVALFWDLTYPISTLFN